MAWPFDFGVVITLMPNGLINAIVQRMLKGKSKDGSPRAIYYDDDDLSMHTNKLPSRTSSPRLLGYHRDHGLRYAMFGQKDVQAKGNSEHRKQRAAQLRGFQHDMIEVTNLQFAMHEDFHHQRIGQGDGCRLGRGEIA